MQEGRQLPMVGFLTSIEIHNVPDVQSLPSTTVDGGPENRNRTFRICQVCAQICRWRKIYQHFKVYVHHIIIISTKYGYAWPKKFKLLIGCVAITNLIANLTMVKGFVYIKGSCLQCQCIYMIYQLLPSAQPSHTLQMSQDVGASVDKRVNFS